MRPDMYQKSIFDIDYQKLSKKGIKVLLFDLDNTIIPQNKDCVDKTLIDLFKKIKASNIKPVLFSNSLKSRVKKVASQLDIEYIYLALKPFSPKFKLILKKEKIAKKEIAIVGDQLYTDIKGGNKFGIKTILIDQVSAYDSFFTKINRKREAKLIQKLDIKKGEYYE